MERRLAREAGGATFSFELARRKAAFPKGAGIHDDVGARRCCSGFKRCVKSVHAAEFVEQGLVDQKGQVVAVLWHRNGWDRRL